MCEILVPDEPLRGKSPGSVFSDRSRCSWCQRSAPFHGRVIFPGVGGHLDGAAVNICVQVYLGTCVFILLRCVPGCRLAGSCGAGGGGFVAQSCLTLCNPVDCSPPGSSVHGIARARTQEWVAISFSRGPSQPRDQAHVSCIGRFGSCIRKIPWSRKWQHVPVFLTGKFQG